MPIRIPVLVLSLAMLALIPSPAFGMGASSARSTAGASAHVLLRIINRDRKQAGVGPLHLTRKLCRVATAHSLDMADHHYFAHDTPVGVTPFARLAENGIRYSIAGENLGFDNGYGTETDMLEAIDQAMMLSPDHRANLLDTAFKHVGIGIAVSAGSVYVTEDFTG